MLQSGCSALRTSCERSRCPTSAFHSVGRGWPVDPALPSSGRTGGVVRFSIPDRAVGPLPVVAGQQPEWAARTQRRSHLLHVMANAPKGVHPLAVDLFTLPGLLQDRALWSDPRYFRCTVLPASSSNGARSAAPTALASASMPLSARIRRVRRPGAIAIGTIPAGNRQSLSVSRRPRSTMQLCWRRPCSRRTDPALLRDVPGEWSGRYEWPAAVTESWYAFALWNSDPDLPCRC